MSVKLDSSLQAEKRVFFSTYIIIVQLDLWTSWLVPILSTEMI